MTGGPRPSRHRPAGVYPRLLRLRHLTLEPWMRVLLADVPVALGILLALADLASAWVVVVLPLSVAAVVKGHDLLAGLLARRPGRSARRARAGTTNGATPQG